MSPSGSRTQTGGTSPDPSPFLAMRLPEHVFRPDDGRRGMIGIVADRSGASAAAYDEDNGTIRTNAVARTVARLMRLGHQGQRLHRSPQLAHAAGGLSDNNASRND